VLYEFGDFNLTGDFAPVWQRENNSGFALRSAGCFLVLESREHAEARGRQALCETDEGGRRPRARKQPGAVTKSLEVMWRSSACSLDNGNLITGATARNGDGGRKGRSWPSIPALRCGATGTMFGHTLETSFRSDWRWLRFRSRAAPCFRPTIRRPRGEKTDAPTQDWS